MAIKLEENGTYTVLHSRRHPETGIPTTIRWKGIKTKVEANRAMKQAIIEMEEKFRKKKIPTWLELIEMHLSASIERGLTAKTVEDYRLCLMAHTDEWFGRLIDTITTEEIRELMKRRTQKSITQQKKLIKVVRGAFNFAVEAGFIIRNPTPNLVFKMGDKIRRVLTEPQAKLLLERAKQMRSEWYPIWAMAIYTGMRNGELYALTWDKVNFETNQILVNCSWNKIDGYKDTKSGDDRIVDMAPPLVTMLKQLKLENNDTIHVLPRLDNWNGGNQAVKLRMFLMGMGIEPVSFHSLRATWATLMLSKGVEPIKVMTMGGWKDIKTMMIYARKAGVDIKGVASVLSGLHNPSMETAKVLKLESCSEL